MTTILYTYIVFMITMLFLSLTKYVSLQQGKWLFTINLFLIAFLTARIVPDISYDLNRYYLDLITIKNSKIKFWDFVFNSVKLTDSNYKYTYTFNAIRYIISKYFPKETLPFFSVCVCYGVFGYVLHDRKKSNTISNYYIVLSILLSNTFLPLLHVYSGIRTAMAMAIIAFVVYSKIYKQLKIIPFIVLTALATFMHPLAFIAVPIIFLSRFRVKKKSVIFIVLIPKALYMLMEQFRLSNIEYLRLIGIKFYNYTFVYTSSQGRFFQYSAIVMTVILLLLSFLQSRPKTDSDQMFINFLSWYNIFALANIRSYNIIFRLPYLYGILAPVIVHTLFNYKQYNGCKRIFYYFTINVSFLIAIYGLYVNYAWMA